MVDRLPLDNLQKTQSMHDICKVIKLARLGQVYGRQLPTHLWHCTTAGMHRAFARLPTPELTHSRLTFSGNQVSYCTVGTVS